MNNYGIDRFLGQDLASNPTVKMATIQVEFINQASEQFKRARIESGKTIKEISAQTNIPQERISAFEIGHPADEISLSEIAILSYSIGKTPKFGLY